MKNLYKNEQSGRSMIEMLGVLAIIGVLSVGGISGYSKAMGKFKLTKAQDQISMLLMNIRTVYATSPDYTNLSNANAIAYNIVPADMVSGANIYNAFGGAVTLGLVGTTQFTIKFEGLAPETCRSLISSDWGKDGLVSIEGTTGGKKTIDALPLDMAEANAACSAATNGNHITWTYY